MIWCFVLVLGVTLIVLCAAEGEVGAAISFFLLFAVLLILLIPFAASEKYLKSTDTFDTIKKSEDYYVIDGKIYEEHSITINIGDENEIKTYSYKTNKFASPWALNDYDYYVVTVKE